MKKLILITVLALSSCANPYLFSLENDPSWEMKNPLDSDFYKAEVNWHSPAWGTFGPGGEHYPYRPEIYEDWRYKFPVNTKP